MTVIHDLANYCLTNLVSTTEASDALGKSGVFSCVKPINPGLYKVGRVKCVFAAYNSNWELHDQIVDINKGDIILLLTHHVDANRSAIGELIAKYILLYKQAAAIIVDGVVRDISSLQRYKYPIWSKGSSPLGCFNHKVDPFPVEQAQQFRDRFENGIAICDDGGVVIVEREMINLLTLEKFKQIEMQEDIWFFCLDTLKWSTKDIVRDKRYLLEPDLLPRPFYSHIEDLSNPRN